MEALQELVLQTHDRIIGPELFDIAVYDCISEAPRGGERAGGQPPMHRGNG